MPNAVPVCDDVICVIDVEHSRTLLGGFQICESVGESGIGFAFSKRAFDACVMCFFSSFFTYVFCELGLVLLS